jgi:hypothetical protein
MKFKVVEIIDARTIKVFPRYYFEYKVAKSPDKINLTGDLVEIEGIVAKKDDSYFKFSLSNFLLEKEVELVNARVYEDTSKERKVSCTVLLDNMNVLYYFPDWKGYSRSSGYSGYSRS